MTLRSGLESGYSEYSKNNIALNRAGVISLFLSLRTSALFYFFSILTPAIPYHRLGTRCIRIEFGFLASRSLVCRPLNHDDVFSSGSLFQGGQKL
jgi:hypothetical protein